ncbi:DUF1048 domain-containing protein [Lacticaseibacillus parakribbianus]|uniref:DUF1048 domain-containing protein n=1 Tax=Lacticaseibacillus parakribbianus TaxID=2970927 RepID=UPI0021CB7CC9|nr:DUF1048 domain-containing protein [Lacticaseibacillus parakribbianus]
MSVWQEKKAWRDHVAAVSALPHDYEVVYRELQKYLFKVGPIAWNAQVSLLDDILALFEDGAAAKQDVLAVTGPDVAAFADRLIEASEAATFAKYYR